MMKMFANTMILCCKESNNKIFFFKKNLGLLSFKIPNAVTQMQFLAKDCVMLPLRVAWLSSFP